MTTSKSLWYCVNPDCGEPLGDVFGGELRISENIKGALVETRGPNVVIKCPKCGTAKVWYTSDRLYRALSQLIDAIAEQGAKRMLFTLMDEARKLEKSQQ